MHHALEHGQALVAGTRDQGSTSDDIAPWHGYSVVSVFRQGSTWKLKLRNPWAKDGPIDPQKKDDNDGYIVLTWLPFRVNFKGYATA